MDEDEDLPQGPSLETFGAFGGGKGATDNQLRCALFAPAITGEGVVCDVTLAPLTQSACAPLLTPYGQAMIAVIPCWSR